MIFYIYTTQRLSYIGMHQRPEFDENVCEATIDFCIMRDLDKEKLIFFKNLELYWVYG